MSKLFKLLGVLLVISSLALPAAACTASVEHSQILKLTVTTPQNGATVTESPITVSGTTNKTATVKVNNAAVPVKKNNFSTTLPLKEGTNEIKIVATAARSSIDGEETVTTILTITYKK